MKIPSEPNEFISSEFLEEIRNRRRIYTFAVWVLPISAVAITLGAAALATLDVIPSHWPPRFGSLCVATGVISLNHLARPNYKVEKSYLQHHEDMHPQFRKNVIREMVLADSNVLFGTLMWGFGDLFFS